MSTYHNLAVLIAAAVAWLAVTDATQREPFTLEEWVSGEFGPGSYFAEWISDTELLYLTTDGLLITDIINQETTTAVPHEILDMFEPKSYSLSRDRRFVLLSYGMQSIYRHASRARYIVYNTEEQTRSHVGAGEHLQQVEWGPESSLIYVYENNIYYLMQPDAVPVQLTSDGSWPFVFNGITNEYREDSDIQSSSLGKAGMLSWSKDGSQLAFGQYNASLVNLETLFSYGNVGDTYQQYPVKLSVPYSKPGTPIATEVLKLATLPTADSTSVFIQELLAPADVVGQDHRLGNMYWIDDNILLVEWSNRIGSVTQTVTYRTSHKAERLHGQKVLTLEQKDGWLETQHKAFRYGQPSTYLTIAWEPQGKGVSYPHVVKVTDGSRKAITSGEVTVTQIYGWAPNGTVYYQASEAGQPSSRHVFAVEEGGSPRCLSCAVFSPGESSCRRASASFTRDFNLYSLTCHGPDPLVASLNPIALPEGNIYVLYKDSSLREELSRKQLPERLDDWVDVGDGVRVQVRMWLPPGLDPKGSEKRPAIVYVNAAPGSQQVDDSYQFGPQNYFTTSRRYVYVFVDGRGSGCKGDKMLFSVYRRLGSVEVNDQINVTQRLTEKYPFIDSSRVAIWGWGYGGYAAAMALAQDERDVFSCGVSVAPITSWLYYESKYTEHYMGLPTPEDNEAGYSASDVTRLAARFVNKTFLLVHGMADDNVLYQNSIMLTKALQEAGVLFSQQSYPDSYHWINSKKTHLYHTIDDFFLKCFDRQMVSSAVKTNVLLMTVTVITAISVHLL